FAQIALRRVRIARWEVRRPWKRLIARPRARCPRLGANSARPRAEEEAPRAVDSLVPTSNRPVSSVSCGAFQRAPFASDPTTVAQSTAANRVSWTVARREPTKKRIPAREGEAKLQTVTSCRIRARSKQFRNRRTVVDLMWAAPLIIPGQRVGQSE